MVMITTKKGTNAVSKDIDLYIDSFCQIDSLIAVIVPTESKSGHNICAKFTPPLSFRLF